MFKNCYWKVIIFVGFEFILEESNVNNKVIDLE